MNGSARISKTNSEAFPLVHGTSPEVVILSNDVAWVGH